MKSTRQRDIYAEALARYKTEVPVEEWPIQHGRISKSGLERAIRARGHPRFERKRLESSRCQPLLDEMNAALTQLGAQCPPLAEAPDVTTTAREARGPEIRILERRVEELERDLKRAESREKKFRERCRLLEAEVEAIRSQHDAFEQHCLRDLRTLHA